MEHAHILFAILGFSASIIAAVFGFGTALIVLALGSYILPIKEVIVLATVLFFASNIVKTVLFSRHSNWKISVIMALASFPFAYLGASLLGEVPSELLKQLLGAMVLVYLGLTVFRIMPKPKIGIPALVTGSGEGVFWPVMGLTVSAVLAALIGRYLLREMSSTQFETGIRIILAASAIGLLF